MENVDIAALAESIIYITHSHNTFLLVDYHSHYWLDKLPESGGILVYVKFSIPLCQLNFPNLPFRIQTIQ